MGKKKEKKKKKRFLGKFIFLLLLAGAVYVGFKYFREDIVNFVSRYIPEAKALSNATPTPTPYDLGGVTLKCYGGEWDNLDSQEELYKNAKAEIEKKYNVVLEKAELLTDDEFAFKSAADVLRESVEKGEPAADIVNLSSSLLYTAFYSELFPDVTDSVGFIEVGSPYLEAGTWKGKVYGVSYDKIRDMRFIVYKRDYIEALEMELPSMLFVEGKWDYDRFEIYLRKLKEKLPKGVYPIGMDPYEWLSMAAGANGSVLLDNNMDINLADEGVMEAVRFYQKLEADELAYPMTAVYDDMGSIIDLDYAAGFSSDKIALKTASISELPADTDNIGIVCFPWGSKVHCDDYYLTISDDYLVPTGNWSIDAPVKAACEKKGLDPAILTRLIYDYNSACSEDTVKLMHKVWINENKKNVNVDTTVEGIFATNLDNVIFDWAANRFVPDYSSMGYAVRMAGYDTLCGYADPSECFNKWIEEWKTELENPILEY